MANNTKQTSATKLHVIKRNGDEEKVYFDKISLRISSLCYGLNMEYIDVQAIVKKIIEGLYAGVTTRELDILASEISASMITIHTDYGKLAARIAISNLHKETKDSFSSTIEDMYNYCDAITHNHRPMISLEHYNIVATNRSFFDTTICMSRDYLYSYFGIKTLERSYLLRIDGRIVERPQYMLMRVALGIHGNDFDSIIETYELLSKHYFIHATPTLFSAATPKAQLSSCYLLAIKDDSISGIFDTVSDCAIISKASGGIGLHVHDVRAYGSRINGTNGTSNGIVPMLRVYNNVARYVDQGGGKRMGSFAIYLEPWHADIFEFLDLKKNHGNEENRARDLFYGLWIPDLFMERVRDDNKWSLMCPYKCPGLADVWGHEFNELYTRYENEKRFNCVVNARKLWYAIIESQVETGTPYMMYKDSCNRKSNQQNLGTIKCSNLCTEIVEYTAPDEIAVCNLASVALNKFVNIDETFGGRTFDFAHLKSVIKTITRNLNKIIDTTYYPLPETKRSNLRHRPIGIGVQGFANALIMLRCPYESDQASLLNRKIFETIYYGALEASCELAREHGTYESYIGSPISRGILQFDMWGGITEDKLHYNWSELRKKIAKYGVRNSLLVAMMPTASTAQILGNNESFEPYTSNIYTRRVLSGEFNVVNNYLIDDLIKLNLWNDDIRNKIIYNRGSIQNIEIIPNNLRQLYKTVWEISVRTTIDMAAERAVFIDQSQSFNVHVSDPTYSKLSSIHFYGWKRGLKTGMYYLRTKAPTNAIQFTVDKISSNNNTTMTTTTCSRDTVDCLSCGS